MEILRAAGDVWAPDLDRQLQPEELREVGAGANALVALLGDRIDAELLDAAGAGLQVVANVAVGHDNIDLPAARERGVVVTNTPGVLTDATADLAMALILAVTRRLGEGERLVRSESGWEWGIDFMLGRGIQGQTLGIVGLGAIGSAVARRALGFGMSIAYASRNPAPGEADLGVRRMELDELLATTDVVSLHVPLTNETRHLIDARRLGLMRPAAYLVNTARGPVVDEAALADSLAAGQIAGAGLDVFEAEPTVHPRLLELDNVVLLPHLGSATVETRTAMAVLAARNAVAVLSGEGAITQVP